MGTEKSRADFLPVVGAKDFFVQDGSRVLIKQLSQIFSFDVSRVERIAKGGNNRIFILTNSSGERLLVKFYKKDDRLRLEREYRANAFLLKNGFSVPTTYLRNDQYQYGVYSFEVGEHKSATEVTAKDINDLLDFFVRLQELDFSNVSEPFLKANGAVISCQDIVENNERCLQSVRLMNSEEVHPWVEKIISQPAYFDDIVKMTERVINTRPDSWWQIDKKDQRLSPADFSFHNILFRGEKLPCVLDLEYFGLDNPLHSIAEFIAHDQTVGLSETLYSHLISNYCDKRNLSANEREQLSDFIMIANINWLAIYLRTLTPVRLAERFSLEPVTFDQEDYIIRQIKKMEQRRKFLNL